MVVATAAILAPLPCFVVSTWAAITHGLQLSLMFPLAFLSALDPSGLAALHRVIGRKHLTRVVLVFVAGAAALSVCLRLELIPVGVNTPSTVIEPWDIALLALLAAIQSVLVWRRGARAALVRMARSFTMGWSHHDHGHDHDDDGHHHSSQLTSIPKER